MCVCPPGCQLSAGLLVFSSSGPVRAQGVKIASLNGATSRDFALGCGVFPAASSVSAGALFSKLVVPKSPAWPRGASSPSSPVPQILRIFTSGSGRTTTSPLLRPCRRWKRGSCAVERLQGSLNHVQVSPGCSHALLSSSQGGQGTCRRQETFWSSVRAMGGGVFGDLRQRLPSSPISSARG